MDIVFVFPPASGNRGRFGPHLGTAYLQAELAAKGIECTQFLHPQPLNTRAAAQAVLESRPSIVGLTAYDSNLALVLNIARHVKAESPSTWVVLGGPASTFSHTRILSRHEAIDVCTISEMEEMGPQIIEALAAAPVGQIPDRLRSTPGVAFRSDGGVVSTGFPPLVGAGPPGQCTLDRVKSPYLSGILTSGQPGLLTGRGCNQNCVYCCFAALGRRTIRLHSLDRVMDELEVIAEHARASGEQRVVTFHDDTFTLLPERAKQLCERLIDRQLGLSFSCITRADKIDAELLRIMREAGFLFIAFGLESAAPAVLRKIGKVRPPNSPDRSLAPERDFVERVRSAVLTAKELGMMVGVSIILGLPGEERQDAEATLSFVQSLPVDYYMHNVLQVFEGTPLYKTCDSDDIQIAEGPLGLPRVAHYHHNPFTLRPGQNSPSVRDARYTLSLAAHGLCGCCALGSEDVPLGLAVLRAPALLPPVAGWLADVLPPGGVLLHVYDRFDPSHGYSQVTSDADTFMDGQIPSRFYLQLTKLGADGVGTDVWRLHSPFTSFAEMISPEMVRVRTLARPAPMEDWATSGWRTHDICDPSPLFEEPGFVQRVEDWLNAPDLAGRLARCTPPPLMMYPGRLTGDLPCVTLSRIEIEDDGAVRLCPYAPVIGRVGDSLSELRDRASACLSQHERDADGGLRCPAARPRAGNGTGERAVQWLQLLSRVPFYVFDRLDSSQQT